MTVRIAKILGLNKILNLSQQLNIYDEIPELLIRITWSSRNNS